jgi:hypothetical protein
MKGWTKWVGIVLLVIGFVPARVAGQSLAEEIEQLALDYEKLSQLKHLLADMKSAYVELSNGYERIKGIAKGNFNLHQTYLNSLLAVSPVVRDYAKVRAIIGNEAELIREYQGAGEYFSGSGRFSAGELDYFSKLYSSLLSGSLRNLDELTLVLTPGELRMSDAERLGAIDRIDQDMGDRLGFLRVFNNYEAMQAGQRGLEIHDVNTLRGLHGIN